MSGALTTLLRNTVPEPRAARKIATSVQVEAQERATADSIDATWRLPRAPLVALVFLFSAGIVLDRFAVELETSQALAAAICAAIIVFVAPTVRPLRVLQPLALIFAVVVLGMAWHHHRWYDLDEHDLSRFDWGSPTPAWLRGALVEVPEYTRAHPDWDDQAGLTRLRLAATASHDGSGWERATGKILVQVKGDRTDLKMGQPVVVAGVLQAIPGPRNPGESDLRARWRAEGYRLRMNVDLPEGVTHDNNGAWDEWRQMLGQLRTRSKRALTKGLDPEAAPIAAALLLGRRDLIEPDVSDAFRRSGTAHLIAISGLHMHALALLLGAGLMLMRVGQKQIGLAVIIVLVFYTLLVGASPSVVRSAAMSIAVCAGMILDRPIRPANRLGFAGLVTLGLNPANLFDAGCQLSFLSVFALFFCVPPIARRLGLISSQSTLVNFSGVNSHEGDETAREALDRLERTLEPRWVRWSRRAVKGLALLFLASLVVSFVNAPVTASRFHLLSVGGVFLNIPLIGLSVPSLGLTILALAAGLIGGPLAPLGTKGCSLAMHVTLKTVRFGASWRSGYWYVAAPPDWWVWGFYLLLAALCWAVAARRRPWIQGGFSVFLAAWTAWGVGLVWGEDRPSVANAEVLAVDHGLSVVVRSASGQVLLYDCGRMRDERVGQRVIAPALWELGVRQIDHLVLSHADADHYSGLIDLIDRFRIGVVHIPPEFASDRNPQAQRLMAECRGRVVVEELTEGTTLALGGGMKVEVLNPPMVVSAAEPDNSRSLVLDVSADGRHMLLTGDLEGEGLRRLLARPQRPIDVLLAPHHGGLSSNPTSLYAWANAACVVASQKRPLPGARDALRTIEEQGLLVARTWRDGAVRVDWRPDGLRVTHHQKRISTWRLRLDSEVGKLAFTTALALQANRWFALCAAGVLGIGGVVAGVLLAVLEWGAWALVSPSARFAASEAAGVSEPLWQAVEIKAADGAMLRGRWHGGEVGQRSAVAVMLVHGFAEDGSAMLDRAERLREKGYGTLVIDSRARGRSGGEFCTFGAREACDILLWLDFLAAHLGTDAAFVLWGRSMGASIVLNAAQRQTRVAGLILEAPYASLVESVARGLRRKHLPGWLAGGMIARAERIAKSKFMDLNPVNFARQTSLPVLMLLGERDVIAPREQADLIAHALAGPVEVFVSGSANHNQVFQANEQEVSERVLHFVERCTGVLG